MNKRIEFGDDGSFFEINEVGHIIKCHNYQSGIWLRYKVVNYRTLKVGGILNVCFQNEGLKNTFEMIERITSIIEVEEPKVHFLKCIEPYFTAIQQGLKTSELRFNDRDFQVGETIYLEQYFENENRHSGLQIRLEITHVLTDFKGLEKGYCILSFKR